MQKIGVRAENLGTGGPVVYFSSKLHLLGAPGEDNVVKVPLGICVKTDTGQILGNVNMT